MTIESGENGVRVVEYINRALPPNDVVEAKKRWEFIVDIGKEFGINFEDFKKSEIPDSNEILMLVSEL